MYIVVVPSLVSRKTRSEDDPLASRNLVAVELSRMLRERFASNTKLVLIPDKFTVCAVLNFHW